MTEKVRHNFIIILKAIIIIIFFAIHVAGHWYYGCSKLLD